MTTPISSDLRERIILGRDAGISIRALAKTLFVGISTVQRMIKRKKETGSIKPTPHPGGQKPIITDAALPDLIAMVMEKPDRTIDELRAEWQNRTGTKVGRGTMSRSLERAKLTLKKNLSGGRARFREEFVEETGI